MYFTNWRFSSPSIHEYQTSKGDSGPRKKRPEPKLILHEKNFPRRASTGERLRTCVRGTWNRTYLRETSSNLQGSFCPNFSFTEFSMNIKFFVSDLFPFDTGTMDLRTNPFEEGGNDVPQSTDQYMELAQHGIQDVLNISTEVHVFHRNGQTDRAVYWKSRIRPERSFGWNHGCMTDLTVLQLAFAVQLHKIRLMVKPE